MPPPPPPPRRSKQGRGRALPAALKVPKPRDAFTTETLASPTALSQKGSFLRSRGPLLLTALLCFSLLARSSFELPWRTSSSPSQKKLSSGANGVRRSGSRQLVSATIPDGTPDTTETPVGISNSAEWQSMFVQDIKIEMHKEAACKGVIPPQYHPNKNSQPVRGLQDLSRNHQRVLVFLARHGLGNSLRSFVSAFVYAQLSGRRLIRLHAAEHAKVYDLLCESFNCGFDSIRWKNETGRQPMDLYKDFENLSPFYFLEKFKKNSDIRQSLGSSQPVFATRSGSHFDQYWHRDAQFQNCVFSSFKCSSIWCVHSRAMHAFIGRGGPTSTLDFVMSQVLTRHKPETRPSSTPSLVSSEIPRNKRAAFDVALHIRTRTLAIEKSIKSDTERYAEAECQDPASEAAAPGGGTKFLRRCLWECIGRILDTLRENLKSASREVSSRGFTILLATDDEALRPEFLRLLERHGTVYYSSGNILHTSKAGGTLLMRLPTMAEFYLMAKSHTLIEAGSYVSTFAYFSSLTGNNSLAAIKTKDGACALRLDHKAEIVESVLSS